MTTTTSPAPLDLADAALIDDPYPHYARLRGAGGPVYSSRWNCWFAADYESCHAVFGDDRFSAVGQPMLRQLQAAVSAGAREWGGTEAPPVPGSEVDRAQGRRTTGRALTTGFVDSLWPGFERACVERVTELVRRTGPVDAVGDYAIPLVTGLLAELMSVGAADLPAFRAWAESGYRVFDDEAEHRRVVRDIRQLLAETAVGRLRCPADDFVGHLAANPGTLSSDSGIGAHLEFVLGTGLMISLVTHQGLVLSFSTLLRALLDHPGQYAALRGQRDLLAGAVEEGLRFDSSTQALGRLATEDVPVRGTVVPQGGLVLCLVGSANRDALRWPDAGTFDVRRDVRSSAHHLTFGLGATSCLGAAMSRRALGYLLGAVVDAVAGLTPAPGAVRFPEFMTRGFTALPVHLEASA